MQRRIAMLFVVALLGWPAWVQAEVKDASAGGFTIENSRVVGVDAQAAWAALVNDIDFWWPRDHTWWGKASRLEIQPRAGGCFCETDGERQARHMVVVFVDPGRLLRMTGGLGPLQGMGLQGVMEWRLEPAGDKSGKEGTRITLFYRAGGYTPDDLSAFAPVVDQVQALQLGGLADYLDKRGGKRE